MNAQEFIMGHLVPIAATTAVLWLVYRLLFRNSNRLRFNRFFLLTSLLLALAMPLLGLISGTQAPQIVTFKQNLFNGMMLNEVIVTPDGQPVLPEVTVTTNTQSHFSVWQIVGGLYIIGVAVMLLLFLVKLGKLVVLIARSPKRKMNGCTAVYMSPKVPEPVEGPTPSLPGSFSFFRYAIFPNENVDADIMRHEMSHIEHHHSWDILFAELMMILQWFNPFIYLYKKELQSLHEYQADRDVVATGVDKRNYMMLILQQCTAADFSGISNNFSLILTKKRIKMITRNEKAKGLWWRLLATLPVLAILLVANTKMSAQEQQSSDQESISTTLMDSQERISGPDNDSIYDIVDQMPKFPGGEQAMFEFIAKNVKYPEKAKDEGVQGRVFIQFVVEKDGSINEVKLLRGIGGGCDEEAIRVVKAMPKWQPGMHKGENVRVSYCLPIFFKLNDETKDAKGNGLVGTIWEGTGTGTKDGVTYTWHSIMQFTSENEGLFIEKLTSQKKNEEPVVEFENVAMDFEYAFDGKKTGAITPKNGDGTYMDELPPEGFVLNDDGKTIVFHFYTAKEDTGIEYVTYNRK